MMNNAASTASADVCASSMVAKFSWLLWFRSSTIAMRSASPVANVWLSCSSSSANLAMAASNCSTLAECCSMSSWAVSWACLFFWSSPRHHSPWPASAAASVCSLVMSSQIMFLTLSKASSCTGLSDDAIPTEPAVSTIASISVAKWPNDVEASFCACSRKNPKTFCSPSCGSAARDSCDAEDEAFRTLSSVSSSDPSAGSISAASTDSPSAAARAEAISLRISTAFDKALISSTRNWFSSS
mmetsp:Transcript_54647/g.137967  ORF Transcript_54647/g.137967 Transcript_54647/m.137967 type:complete len:242 (+) Transcript_54647:3634-4359(+)